MSYIKYIKRCCTALLLATLTLQLSSCGDDYLDRTSESSYNIDNFYQSDEALDAATAPLYNRAWFYYNMDMGLAAGSIRANECYNPSFMVSFTTFQVTALDSYNEEGWYGLYSVVIMANSVIDAANNRCTGVSDEAVRRNIAEARLMRGVAYFYMLRTWGPVILFENNEDVSQSPRKNLNTEEDVLKFIINDFTYAAENLPSKAKQTGRATKWAAEALLAKAYLARSGWNKTTRDADDLAQAVKYATDVCENSGQHLLDDYANLFKYKYNNNEESLLAMQWVPLGSWQECNTMISTLTFQDDKLTGSGTDAYSVWGAPMATVDQLNQYEQGDTARLDASFFTNGTHYSYLNMAEGGYDYEKTCAFIKKGVLGQNSDDNDNKISTMNSPLNTYIIRLADVYLTLAEACLGNNESLSDSIGLEYFNKLRARAKLTAKSSITLDDIIRERRCEFGGEWVNWYDMVTWYRWKPTKMLQYFKDQDRGAYCDNVKKNSVGDAIVMDESAIIRPSMEIEVSADNIFLPYPETDVIQNTLLKEDPVAYDFNE